MDAPINVKNVRIETERLILRSWHEDDLEVFYMNAFAEEDEDIDSAMLPPIEVFQRILNNIIAESKTFVLALKDNGEIIGSLGLQPRHADSGLADKLHGREISYGLHKDHRGKGYMTEAVYAVCNYCFKELNYDYLTCGCFDGNEKSKHVMERCGFCWLKDIDTVVEKGKTVPGKLYVRYNPNK